MTDFDELADRLRAGASTVRDRTVVGASRFAAWLQTSQGYAAVVIAMLLVAAVAGLYASLKLVGPINTVAYAVVFVTGLYAIPGLIGVMGGGVPFDDELGRIQLILMATAYGHHYLVQRDSKWEWCPGDEERVWVDREWHDLDGLEHKSHFAWQPFGIVRFKDDETLVDTRVDTQAEVARDPLADGGALAVNDSEGEVMRGGYPEADPAIQSGLDGAWLIDLKRLYSRGISRIADIEVIETAEEIIERGQVDETKMGSSYRPFIETLFGLLAGVITGYLYVFLS